MIYGLHATASGRFFYLHLRKGYCMKTHFRILPPLLLCFALMLSGCSMLEKQKLSYQPQNDVAIWMNSLAGLSGE